MYGSTGRQVMERDDECLEPDDVAAFIDGGLPPQEIMAVQAHVARCADCRIRLSWAARSDSMPVLASPSLGATRSEPGAGDLGIDVVPGARVGRYVLGDRLGACAMGVVFEAHDTKLDRRVAVKLVRSDAGVHVSPTLLRRRLVREARAMAQLAHPNVVAVYDVGSYGEHVFIAMELVEGRTLAQWLAAERRPVRAVVAMFVAAGRGLAAAHAAGVVHRDFKPRTC
jgi:serine/threonine protein kinase